jgi:hypothetical protein
MNRGQLISKLPPVKGEEVVIAKRQDTEDIMAEVLRAHQAFATDYDCIADGFAGPGAEKKLYDFCRKNLAYDVESEDLQTTRSPSVLLRMGRCDCKGYAGFVAGVLDGLNRSGKGQYNWRYRFANYEEDEEQPGHVFVVVEDPDGRETWIDPVLNEFDKRDPAPLDWVDKARPMTLVRMSGATQPVKKPATLVPMPAAVIASPLSAYRVGYAPAPGYTAGQLGIPIMQAVFQHWGSEYPAAVAELLKNPPVKFMVGNTQIPLPAPVTYGGEPVPPLPKGIRLQWDSSFMGLPIPPDMLNVQENNGALQVWPLEIMSAGGTGAATNNYLWNTHRYLLFLFLGALENLIYSYSSWPWGNGFNDLAQQLNSARNYGNWLVYPGKDKKTFFGSVLTDIATVQQVLAPIESAVLNIVAPGAGTLVSAGTSLLSQATGVGKDAGSYYPVTGPSGSGDPSGAPGGSSSSMSFPSITDTLVQFAQANPIPTLAIAAAAALLINELFD